MIAHPLYDPPEYQQLIPTEAETQDFDDAVNSADEALRGHLAGLLPADHLRLYGGLVRNRLHDHTLARWARTGRISKAWLGTGEEACTIGPVHALDRGRDALGPMIRNAGACHEAGMPLADLFRAYLGTGDSPSLGRDLHAGSWAHRVVTPISHVGALVPVMAGVALSYRLKGEAQVAMTWVGDGASHVGEVHEGLSVAAAQRAPLILILQDNQIALGTLSRCHRRGDLAALGALHGLPTRRMDGNHILLTWAASRWARACCVRGEGPVLLIAETFRMGGHATHDIAEGRRLLPQEAFEYWGRRCPLIQYRAWLERRGPQLDPQSPNAARLDRVEAEVKKEILQAETAALHSLEAVPTDPKDLEGAVWAQGAAPRP